MKIGVYKYNGSVCGASFAIPQIAGLFLLSRQIDKDIRFNEFINIIKSPQMVNKDGTNYINASEIIKQVEKNKIEKDRIVPPQEKSTQELGKETIGEQSDTEAKIKIEKEYKELESKHDKTEKGN